MIIFDRLPVPCHPLLKIRICTAWKVVFRSPVGSSSICSKLSLVPGKTRRVRRSMTDAHHYCDHIRRKL